MVVICSVYVFFYFICFFFVIFFFQAEDGIRDTSVTGVQTSALPISPFPDELVAAPAGGAIAWVYNAQGARNLWIATPAEYQGRALTTYKEDDGQELGELARSEERRVGKECSARRWQYHREEKADTRT